MGQILFKHQVPIRPTFLHLTEITQDAGEMFQKIVHNNQLQNKVKIKCLKIFLKNPIYFLGLKNIVIHLKLFLHNMYTYPCG